MRRAQNQRGFTLIEIMVAVTLLSVGLLGMAGLTVGIMRSNSLSNQVTTATALAQAKMEDIKRVGYSGVAEGKSTDDYNDISGYPLYKRVTDVDVESPDPGMKTVTITVSWDSDASSITVETILTP